MSLTNKSTGATLIRPAAGEGTMDLAQLKSFLALAETLHFGRAAERIHLSQPALSLQIRALEGELGVELFARTRRRTEITAAGEVFRDEVTGALSALDRAVARARAAAAGQIGCVRVGFISTAAALVLPPMLNAFRTSHPEVAIEMRHALTAEQIALLRQGAIDVGFFRVPAAATEGLVAVAVHAEPFRLFLPAAHPLARLPHPTLADLDGRDVLIYARRNAPGFHDLLLRIFTDAGVNPVLHEANDMSTLMAMVAAGVGAAVAPASVEQMAPLGAVPRDLDGLPSSVVVMAYREDETNPAVRAFVDLVIAAAAFDA